jgi:hypothetical protein
LDPIKFEFIDKFGFGNEYKQKGKIMMEQKQRNAL